jgi:hypothetical protein
MEVRAENSHDGLPDNPGNSKHIQSLVALATTLHGCLELRQEAIAASAQMLTVNDFLFSKGLDNLNFFRLIRCK